MAISLENNLSKPHINALYYLFHERTVRSKIMLIQNLECPKSYNKDYLKDLSNWGYILKIPLLEDMREVQYQLSPLGEKRILELIEKHDLQRAYPSELEAHLHAS